MKILKILRKSTLPNGSVTSCLGFDVHHYTARNAFPVPPPSPLLCHQSSMIKWSLKFLHEHYMRRTSWRLCKWTSKTSRFHGRAYSKMGLARREEVFAREHVLRRAVIRRVLAHGCDVSTMAAHPRVEESLRCFQGNVFSIVLQVVHSFRIILDSCCIFGRNSRCRFLQILE